MTSKTFKTLKELKEFMALLSITEVKTAVLSRTIANNFNIKYHTSNEVKSFNNLQGE